MAKKHEVQMPEDWNDHQGWDTYHESRLARPKRDPWDDETGTIGIEHLPQLAEDVKSWGWREAWIPGCGLSPLARLLAHLGMQTVATDVSPVAVGFQRDRAGDFNHLTARLGPAVNAGSFVAELHDFRTEFRREAFDFIINVKATRTRIAMPTSPGKLG